ncbi:MAG: luciferase family protein [Thermoleophilia bacterium]
MARRLGPKELIVREVTSWPGVTQELGRFGATRLMLGHRELGHLHGDWMLDLPLTRDLRDRLMAEGRVEPHRAAPASGWASRAIAGPQDIPAAIALLRTQFERAARAARARERGRARSAA